MDGIQKWLTLIQAEGQDSCSHDSIPSICMCSDIRKPQASLKGWALEVTGSQAFPVVKEKAVVKEMIGKESGLCPMVSWLKTCLC